MTASTALRKPSGGTVLFYDTEGKRFLEEVDRPGYQSKFLSHTSQLCRITLRKSEVTVRREVAGEIGRKISACSGARKVYRARYSKNQRIDDVLNGELSASS
jgi:hypothetical protein